MRRDFPTFVALLTLAGATLLALPEAAAQDKPASATPQPTTTSSPQISLDELKLALVPLTKDELVVEADGWLDIVKQKASDVALIERQALKAEGEAKQQLQQQATQLREQRVVLTDRLDAALDALVRKGAVEDRATYDQYVAAVSGISVDPTDVAASWTAIQGWLFSDQGGIRWAVNILKFLATVFVFRILAGVCSHLMAKALSKAGAKISDILRTFVVNTTRRIVFLLGFIMALSLLGIDIGPLLAGVGVVGFVLGFALQDTLANFAAGFMILLNRPYDVGNVVTAAGVTGSVESMSLVSTTLKTPDNQRIIVPNGSIWGGVIQNVTSQETRRVDLVFGCGYADDVAKAQSVLEEIVNSHELILKDPEPVIRLHELADSSVNFVVRPWTRTSDYWTVYWDLTRSVKDRFDAEGLSIPYPQQDVHMHQVAVAG